MSVRAHGQKSSARPGDIEMIEHDLVEMVGAEFWSGVERRDIDRLWRRSRGGEDLPELCRKQIEINRVDRPTVIEITLAEGLAGLPEISGQQVEVERVDGAIVISVGGVDKKARHRIRRQRGSDGVGHLRGINRCLIISVGKNSI